MFNVLMPVKVDSSPCFVIALITMQNTIWTRLDLLLVAFLMQSQMFLFAKNTDGLFTAVTVEFFIVMFSSNVCIEIALFRKAPFAMRAFQFFMFDVLYPIVFVQNSLCAKCSWTECTLVSYSFMLGQFVLDYVRS